MADRAAERAQIAAAYGKHTSGARTHSRIAGLREFNNYVKTMLVKSNARDGCAVLDLCAGKGGDLAKYADRHARRVAMVDIAGDSVVEAAARFAVYTRHHEDVPPFALTLVHGDSFRPGLLAAAGLPRGRFDLAVCQFALHYSFASAQDLDGLLSNVSDALAPGGRFVGTTVDSQELVRRLRDAGGTTFGNALYRVACTHDYDTGFSVFGNGARYTFTLDGAVDGLPEYLVDMPTLLRAAMHHGLALVPAETARFTSYVKAHLDTDVANAIFTRTCTPDENEIIGLYTTFVFEKRAPAPGYAPVVDPEPPHVLCVPGARDIVRL